MIGMHFLLKLMPMPNIFSKLLVKELTDCVPSARFHSFKTFQAALTHYTCKYHKTGGVIHSPIAGSRWNDEMEDAVNSIQEQHTCECHGGASHT